jgi:adenylate cyclase
MGDGVLVEFSSPVNAIACAMELQKRMAAANDGQPEDRRILLRIGINLGDVIVEGGDLYGDGVNIAARLQTVAEPGAICVSAKVREEVGRKLAVNFEDLGARGLKNVDAPMHIYRVVGTPAVAAAAQKPSSDRPSIAVLPFVNMSGDPDQEYFSDGITEDIITDLSQVSALFVVARHTAFALKGKAIHVQQAASDLRVQYILEGSVRKAANRVRITAQLIDGTTGGHVWASRYDRDFSDIFSLQDEISKNVVDALKVKILPAELETITSRSTADPEAYRYYLVGHSLFLRDFGAHSFQAARRMFAKAAEIDPSYGRAYAGMAACDAFLWVFGDTSVSSEQILSNSSRALELEPDLAEAHAAAGMASYASGLFEEATVELDRALKLDPSLWEACLFYADCCRGLDVNKAVALFERAAELKSDDFMSLAVLAALYRQRGNVEQSVAAGRRSFARIEAVLSDRPDNADAIAFGAIHLANQGRSVEAEHWVDRAIVVDPDNYMVRYNAACTYALLNKADASIDNLELIFSRVPRWHGWLLNLMRHDPDFELLRGNTRFQEFLRRLASEMSTQP